MMKVGILGGTFDPIHHGHLIVAEEARCYLSLDEVLFVPAGLPWQKRAQEITGAEHRVAMIRLAIATNPAFKLSLVDVERPGPSYSVDSVIALKERYPADTTFWYLVGMDAAAGLSTWKESQRLLSLCQMVALSRPGCEPFQLESLEEAIPQASTRITRLEGPLIGISSSEVRERVHRGQSIKYLVPEAVERYIAEKGLYRA